MRKKREEGVAGREPKVQKAGKEEKRWKGKWDSLYPAHSGSLALCICSEFRGRF